MKWCDKNATVILFFLLTMMVCTNKADAAVKSTAKLNVLFVFDGLRPDVISPENTPTLFELAQEGVWFENSHAVFPTVTRVNSAAIATGAYPIVNGIVSNSMYVPAVKKGGSFSTGDYSNLLKLDELTAGGLLQCKSWAQRLVESGKVPAALSSGSTGTSFLQNHRAPQGVGILVNGYFQPGELVAFPESVNRAVLDKVGPAPSLDGAPNYNVKINWLSRVLNEYVMHQIKPDVIYCWLTEPDHTQHGAGIGSPETLETVRNSDKVVETFIKELEHRGLYETTNIFVVSDHGFSTYEHNVNVAGALIDAGLKISMDSDDVVLASSGQSVLLHVKNRDENRIKKIVDFLLKQDWCGVLFTKGAGPAPENFRGAVDGTFSLELIHQPSHGRGADIILTFPWSSRKNEFGYPGTDYSSSSRPTGPRSGPASGHGSMSPWTIRNTMIAWGADIKSGVKSRVPSCSIDITATILALNGVPLDKDVQGRVLAEALKQGPDPESVFFKTDVFRLQGSRSEIQISSVGNYWYVDKSRRWEEK